MDAASNGSPDRLAQAVVRALTGQAPAGGLPAVATPAALGAWLVANGWTVERLRARQQARRADGLRWPEPVPAPQRQGVGAAQCAAATRAVLASLGLDHGPAVLRDASQTPGEAERRLLADVPPHHGRVG